MNNLEKYKNGSTDGGLFGEWVTDEEGLPAFDYIALSEIEPDNAVEIDHWHQVGNDRYTAEAHAGGWIIPYRWEHGLTRLAEREAMDWRTLAGVGLIRDSANKETPLVRHLLPRGWYWKVRWGVGYAEWFIESEIVRIRKKLSAPFGDDPVFIIEIEMESHVEGLTYEERWPVIPYTMGLPLPMTRYSPAPDGIRGTDRLAWRTITGISGSLRRIGEIPRRFYSRLLKWDVRKGADYAVGLPRFRKILPTPPQGQRTWLDQRPEPLFIAVLDGAARSDAEIIDRGVMFSARIPPQAGLPAAKKQKIQLLFGWGSEQRIGTLIDKYRQKQKNTWADHLPTLSTSEEESIDREITWHGAYLRAMMVKDDYFDSHIIPQGSAYSYLHGAHGAIRDYVLCIVPLIYLAPERAREFILACSRMTLPTGEMLYGHVGHGKATGAGGIHAAPTDLSLFFLWAVAEYIPATGDTSILDEVVPFYPKEKNRSSTFRDRVLLAWRYMRDHVGTGPHDLLRAGSGDWNDPISFTVARPGVFHRRGESCFNTAMALWVLPRTAELVETWSAREAVDIRKFSKSLENAMKEAWTGEWYLRGWDGENRPIGEDRIFLDSNVWCLISGIGGAEKMRKLVDNIVRRLDTPSPIGANILDKPVRMKYGILAPGWDCNGGVWAAINGLLCWGYSLYDPDRAWRNLEKQSLAAHARAYPHIWYGIWSGPDAYNAHWAQDPGHTFVHPLTPMREYPIMNSNSHALPLLALLKLAGIEPHGIKIDITPRMPERLDPWRVDFPLISIEMQDGKLKYRIKENHRRGALAPCPH